jgi:hypothetical protein
MIVLDFVDGSREKSLWLRLLMEEELREIRREPFLYDVDVQFLSRRVQKVKVKLEEVKRGSRLNRRSRRVEPRAPRTTVEILFHF